MAAETFINIRGFDALAKTLDEIPAKMEANILRGACRAAAKVIKDEVDKRVPKGKTGNLADSVRITTRVRDGIVQASVKVGGKDAFYANMVEKGTKPHMIVASKSKRLRIGVSFVYPTTVQHPGAKANPFMHKSIESGSSPAIEAFRNYVEKRLDKLT